MKIYGLEKLSLVDFDGKVASTIFTGSCNFRCPFCHNGPLVVDLNNQQVIEEEEIFSYLTKRKGIIEGVCISGGEPTLSEGLLEFAKKLKDMGLAVKLDTNGTNPEMIESLAKEHLVDHFAMDIKNDIDSYSEIIGLKNYDTKNVEKSVEFFLSNNYSYEFRTTLIKEFHTKNNILNIGKWIKGAKKYFLQKFKQSENCLCAFLNEVDEKTATEYQQILKEYVKDTSLRGY